MQFRAIILHSGNATRLHKPGQDGSPQLWLSQACYLLTSVNFNSGVVKGTSFLLGGGGGGGASYVKGDKYMLTFNLNHS